MRRPAALAAFGLALIGAASAAASFSGASPNPGNRFAAASDFCSGGTQTLSASQDTYIRGGTPHGGTSSMIVSPGALLGLSPAQALVQFNLPAVPAFCTLTGATLRLYDAAPAGGRTIRVRRNASAWNESTVTTSNDPALTGPETTSTSPSSAGWQTWNVLSQAQEMYSQNNYGLRLYENAGLLNILFENSYQSSNGTPDSQDPQLQVTFG